MGNPICSQFRLDNELETAEVKGAADSQALCHQSVSTFMPMFSFSFPVSDLDRFELHLSRMENHESLSLSPRNDPDTANKTTPLGVLC